MYFLAEKKDFVVVGGGIPGILAALHLKILEPQSSVLVLEASEKLGGLYKSHFLPEVNAWVDLGMHVYYETGKEEYDTFVESALSREEWSDMGGNRKDLGGIFWRGKLRSDHPYPDLRNENLWLKIRVFSAIVFAALKAMLARSVPKSSEELAVSQFGTKTYQSIFLPILKKLYRTNPSALSEIAMKSPELRRLALWGPTFTRLLSVFKGLRSRIAYPDQFNLPLKRVPQRAFYPKEIGFGWQVVSRLEDFLTDKGVEIKVGSQVGELDNSTSRGLSITVNTESSFTSVIECRKVVWCAPIFPLIRSVNHSLNVTLPTMDKPRTKYFLTALMRGHNPISPLYYFYVYDNDLKSFRVTNYEAYSEASTLTPGEFLLGIELWVDDELSDDEVSALAEEELKKMDVIRANTDLLRTWVLPEKAPPYEPTTIASEFFLESVKSLTEHFEGNLIISGPFTKPGLFFLQDILRDLHDQLKELDVK